MSDRRMFMADYIEAGTGPLVVLVHASMSGARQWKSLMQALDGRFRLRAINLFGYGQTPAWSDQRPPTLEDYGELVASAVPPDADGVTVIGHSFGGAVAMEAARRLDARAAKLVLVEPSIFCLLAAGGRNEAHAEIAAVRDDMARLPPEAAAERFIGFWTGPESWAATPPERQAAYVRGVETVRGEFGAAFGSKTGLFEWGHALPKETLVIWAADTKRPSREVVELLSLAGASWKFARVPEGGHMSPLTHPELVNPVIAAFLDGA